MSLSLSGELIRNFNPPAEVYARRIDFADDGSPIDADTGEILDPADPEVLAAVEASRIVDRITTVEGADKALAKLAWIEAETARLEAVRDAFVANLNAMIGVQNRRRKWWDLRYRADVVEVAKGMLGKGKTALFGFGRVSFRRSAGTRSIESMDAAVSYVRRWAPQGVKVVESVTLKAIDAAVDEEAEACGEASPLPFLSASGPRESVSISTGVKGDDRS